MENPAVTVTVTVIRPATTTEFWSDTVEGHIMTLQILSVLESHAPNIEISLTEVDSLTRTMVVMYDTVDVYNQSRSECLALEPTFTQKRDEYYDAVGGSVTQDVVFA